MSNRLLKGKFKCAEATCFASDPNVESKMPSVCTTSGLFLLKTGGCRVFPAKRALVGALSGFSAGCFLAVAANPVRFRVRGLLAGRSVVVGREVRGLF
jgi:hypothetical protein